MPRILGTCGPEVRNIVDLPDHYLVLTQGSTQDRTPPRVLLCPKLAHEGGPVVYPLLDIDSPWELRRGFTFARASRRDRNGVFFSFRGPRDVFDSPIQFLKWEIGFH